MAKSKGGMTKVEAVRQALAELGPDAKPTQIQGHVKQKFNIDMSRDHVSVTKRQILNKAAGKKKPGKAGAKKLPAQASAARQAGPAVPPQATAAKRASPSIGLDDIEAVKGLLERVGASALHKLIDVMAR
jgi:hypothetical protein